MWDEDQQEASGTDSEKNHLRQNKGDRSLHGGSGGAAGWTAGERGAVCKEAVAGSCF